MEQPAARAIKVRVFGQEYVIKSQEEEEYVLAVAKLVDEKMREVAGSTSSASTVSVAVLAALNLAAEYLKAREKSQGLEEQLKKRSQELISLIEGS